ncbi:DMT family transporter [Halalkalibacter krulwichiae]|uniref:Putative DMT superfamily transporter inner membrane protein n=1 Tax=Halalkalibacter krulwichiae TaxID=199441 RepID=A0A1X9MHT8_9BACI|nr:DMT family transporter [Halalkalibacter krulwichiae]ARK32244.1 putative DMT superfamily transporter inner membrane protein [Halalkalibacter krulwichiae]
MNKKAFFLAFITILIWGSTFAAIRASLHGGYSAGHLVLVRYLIASVFFLIIALWPGVTFRLPKKEDLLKIFVLGLIGISVYHIGVTFGELTISAGTAGMLIGSAPIFTSIIAVIVLKERLGIGGWIGLAVGFIGIFVITLGTGGSSFQLAEGVFYVLAAAIATSVFFVFQKPLLTRYSAIEIMAYFTWIGTLPFLMFAPGLFETLQTATLEAHLSAIYTGLFPAGIAYITWTIALSMSNASSVGSMMYLEPAVAILVAWVWLQELPSTLSIIGGVIALSGVLLVSLLSRNKSTVEMQKAS